MKNLNFKLFAVYCSLLTILCLATQQTSAEIIFQDNFNNIYGSENVNDHCGTAGRQTGIMSPATYFNNGAAGMVGNGTDYPNWLNKPSGAVSPNLNFTNLNNFVLEFDMIKTNASSWISIVFGSMIQGAAGNVPNGGHGLLIHTTGAYILREGENTLIATGNLPIATNYHFAICVSTESYGGADKPKISIFVNNIPLKVDNASAGYTRMSNFAYTNNYITFYNAGANSIAIDNLTIITPETSVSTKLWLNDADMELDSSRAYSHKINLNAASDVTVNGVVFEYSASGLTNGTNWELGDVSGAWIMKADNTDTNLIALQGKELTANHIESSAAEGNYLKLTGLTPGSFGFLKLYGISKWALPNLPQHRSNYFAISTGGQVIVDQNEVNSGTRIIVKVEYTVPESGELTVALTPVAPLARHRFKWTAFSNYEVVPEPGLVFSILFSVFCMWRKLILSTK